MFKESDSNESSRWRSIHVDAAPARNSKPVSGTGVALAQNVTRVQLVTDARQAFSGAYYSMKTASFAIGVMTSGDAAPMSGDAKNFTTNGDGTFIAEFPRAAQGAFELYLCALEDSSTNAKKKQYVKVLRAEVWPVQQLAFRRSKESPLNEKLLSLWCWLSNLGLLGIDPLTAHNKSENVIIDEVHDALRRMTFRLATIPDSGARMSDLVEFDEVIGLAEYMHFEYHVKDGHIQKQKTVGTNSLEVAMTGRNLEDFASRVAAPASKIDCASAKRAYSSRMKSITLEARAVLPSIFGLDRNRSTAVEVRPFFLIPALCFSQATASKLNSSEYPLHTFVLPGDWPTDCDDRFNRAFPGINPVRKDVDARPLVDGPDAISAMRAAIDRANAPGHFVVILAWQIDLLLQISVDLSLADVLVAALRRGVNIYIITWPNQLDGDKIDEIDKKANDIRYRSKTRTAYSPRPTVVGEFFVVHDDYTRKFGSHHQKVLVVNGSDGLVGFCGGVDLRTDRLQAGKMFGMHDPGTPLHDVHVSLTGTAASDLLNLALDRLQWFVGSNQAGSQSASAALDKLRKDAAAAAPRSASPAWAVQVGRTIGTPSNPASHTIWPMIIHAINRAKRYIYIEDQYFWFADAARALNDALRTNRALHVTILLPAEDLVVMGTEARRDAFQALRRDLAETDLHQRVGVYMRVLNPNFKGYKANARYGLKNVLISPGYHTYIHSKCWIVDDEVAIIGSANCNRRGYKHDSEVVAQCVDLDWDDAAGPRAGCWFGVAMNRARALRIALWAEHLGILPEEQTILSDPIGALVYWRAGSSKASMRFGNRLPSSVVYEYEDEFGLWWKDEIPPTKLIDPKGSALVELINRYIADPP